MSKWCVMADYNGKPVWSGYQGWTPNIEEAMLLTGKQATDSANRFSAVKLYYPDYRVQNIRAVLKSTINYP